MTYTSFKNTTEVGRTKFTESLGLNISAWLNNAFIEIGGFYNVVRAQSGNYGGDQSRLRLVDDPSYDTGQCWEGFRSNWVYESGVNYTYQPINTSGVFIGNNFYYTDSAICPQVIDFPRGRIIFSSGLSVLSQVRAEYSYRYVNVSTNESPWFREFQLNSMRNDSSAFLQQGSGSWDILSQNRVQLPAIVVQPTSRVRFEGLQLGGGHNRYQDVLFHVYAETPWERDTLSDILLEQIDKTIFLYDVNKVLDSGVYPLTFDGDRATGGLQYPAILDESKPYRSARCVFVGATADDYETTDPIYSAIVRITTKTEMS